MRISDWSSDVCSSDLGSIGTGREHARWRKRPHPLAGPQAGDDIEQIAPLLQRVGVAEDAGHADTPAVDSQPVESGGITLGPDLRTAGPALDLVRGVQPAVVGDGGAGVWVYTRGTVSQQLDGPA